MTMSEMAGVVVFRNSTSGMNGSHAAEDESDGNGCSVDYLRAREMAERAAAKRAHSLAARHAHQQLAQHYAELVRRAR
jgi:hypothetical protein